MYKLGSEAMTNRPTNFDAMTCCGIAAGMLLLAVICIGMGKDIAAVHRERGGPETQPASRPAARGAAFRTMEVTAYCPCKKCCGPQARGITASGLPVSENGGRFAAGPPSMGFGTMIRVPGYAGGEWVPVPDRGGAIQGNRLDVYFSTHRQALQFGRQQLLCEVLK